LAIKKVIVVRKLLAGRNLLAKWNLNQNTEPSIL
jgi:hypothetical protein